MIQLEPSSPNAITPLYVESLKLNIAPFSARYSESLYYAEETREDMLKKIKHLTDYTQLLLFVQGAKGVGKTSLLKHRLDAEKSSWRICFISAKDCITADAFIEQLIIDFQLKFSEPKHSTSSQSLQEQIDGLRQMGITLVVIIDDVDAINENLIPILQSLLSHTADGEPFIRLIIAGEDLPEHLTQLIATNKYQTDLKYLPLAPFGEKQTMRYIRFRLKRAGYTATEPFNKEKIHEIYLNSKGFPTKINRLCDKLLSHYDLLGDSKEQAFSFDFIHSEKFKIALIGLTAVTLIALLIIFISGNSDDSNESASTPSSETVNPSAMLAIPALEKKSQPLIEAKPSNPTTPARNSEVTNPPIERIEEKIVTPTVPKKAQIPEPIAKPNIINSEEKTPSVTAEVTKPPTTKSLSWVEQQHPNHYTIQLIASPDKKAVLRFIKKHKIEQDATYVQSKHKGRDWYSVIYKSYASHKKASEKAKNLPASMKRIKPWIRQFKDVQ